MLFGKKEFWVMYGTKLTEEDLMTEYAMYAEANGIRATHYGVKTIKEVHTEKVVQRVCLVHVEEMWRGAAKRFLREQKKENTGCKYKGLAVYG